MQKVFIKAYLKQNLGDDLFIKMLLDRYPETLFCVSASKHYKDVIFKKYSNLDVVVPNESNLLDKAKGFVLRKMSKSLYKKHLRNIALREIKSVKSEVDLFVSIGGSIFMQPKLLPAYYDIEYYNCINSFFLEKPKLYLGCNFGPYSDSSYKEKYEKIFSKAYDVCFREENSYKEFKNIDSVRFAPDIVFGLKFSTEEKIKKSIGFSIIPPSKQTDKNPIVDYAKDYANLINKFIQDDYSIKLFSFCKHEGDENIINEIEHLLQPKENSIKKVFYDGNIDFFLKEYSSVETMFCGRFHAMIISLILKQNIIPVIYSKKMLNVLTDINYKGICVEIDKIKEVDYNKLFSELCQESVNVDEVKINAEKHFKKLDMLIKYD